MLNEKAIDENIGILTLTESHLHDDFLEGEIEMRGFTNYRADRANGVRKGGIITYVRHDLLPGLQVKEAGSIGNIEFLIIFIKELEMLLVTLYRPPSASSTDFKSAIAAIQREIESAEGPTPRVALTGDFNFPSIKWEKHNIDAQQTQTFKPRTL